MSIMCEVKYRSAEFDPSNVTFTNLKRESAEVDLNALADSPETSTPLIMKQIKLKLTSAETSKRVDA